MEAADHFIQNEVEKNFLQQQNNKCILFIRTVIVEKYLMEINRLAGKFFNIKGYLPGKTFTVLP